MQWLDDLRRVREREEQEEREREEVGGEYDYDPDQGYALAVGSDERWAERIEALVAAGAGGGD